MSLLLDVLPDDAQRGTPQGTAKEDGDHKCPCMMGRFTGPVGCDRILRAGAPLRLFTSAGTATVGGYSASGCA